MCGDSRTATRDWPVECAGGTRSGKATWVPPVSDALAADISRRCRLNLSTYDNYGFTVDSCELTTELAADTTTKIHTVTIRPSIPMMSAATARPRPAWSWVRVFRIETVAKMTAARLPRPPIHNRLQTNAVMAVPLYGRCVAGRYPYDCEIPTVFCPSIDVGSSCRNVRVTGMHLGKDQPNGRCRVLRPLRAWARHWNLNQGMA